MFVLNTLTDPEICAWVWCMESNREYYPGQRSPHDPQSSHHLHRPLLGHYYPIHWCRCIQQLPHQSQSTSSTTPSHPPHWVHLSLVHHCHRFNALVLPTPTTSVLRVPTRNVACPLPPPMPSSSRLCALINIRAPAVPRITNAQSGFTDDTTFPKTTGSASIEIPESQEGIKRKPNLKCPHLVRSITTTIMNPRTSA